MLKILVLTFYAIKYLIVVIFNFLPLGSLNIVYICIITSKNYTLLSYLTGYFPLDKHFTKHPMTSV